FVSWLRTPVVIITRQLSLRTLTFPPKESRRMRIRDHTREKRGAHERGSGHLRRGTTRNSRGCGCKRSIERRHRRDIAAAGGRAAETARMRGGTVAGRVGGEESRGIAGSAESRMRLAAFHGCRCAAPAGINGSRARG